MSTRTYLFICSFLLSSFSLQAKPEATRIELYYGIAQGNYLIGDIEGAARGVEQMLKLDPDYTPAITLNSRILLDIGKPELALNAAENLKLFIITIKFSEKNEFLKFSY